MEMTNGSVVFWVIVL